MWFVQGLNAFYWKNTLASFMPNNYRFQLLVPSQSSTSTPFKNCTINEQLYDQSLSSMQRLRGAVFLKDGAIQPGELDESGRFAMGGDAQSWHLLLKTDDERTIGCARYLVHPNTVKLENLRIFQASLAGHREWGERMRQAVEADLKEARENDLSYVEIGGWALSEEWRGSRAALEILTASFALAPMWGGCLAACTATVRHSSASILRRIGGSSFQIGGQQLPPYYDPRYGCTMELLRFDSRSPAERFMPLIKQLTGTMATALTIRRSNGLGWTRRISEFGARKYLPQRMVPAFN
jgi:predicted GNAT family N-acyltransferase